MHAHTRTAVRTCTHARNTTFQKHVLSLLKYNCFVSGDFDRREGRFTIEQALKRQKYVLHGFEARALKHIPRIVFRVCERLLQLANCTSLIDNQDNSSQEN